MIKVKYKCEECDIVYRDRTGLRKHIKAHEKMNKLSDSRVETDKNQVSESTVNENNNVENSITTNNVVLISDDGSIIDQGQLQDVELIYIEES